MSECVYVSQCTFLDERMSRMPAMAELLRHHYCAGEPAGCARFKVADEFGRDAVPSDLFPNQMDVAEELLSRLRSA